MKRFLFAAVLAAFATTPLQAQTVTPGKEAWWLRTTFTATHTEVRGIPVAQIKKGWCKATEFTLAMMPAQEMKQDGTDKLMKELGFGFAVEGNFDRTSAKLVALTGVYQA